MSISFVAKSDGDVGTNYASSISVTKPAGTTNGDLLIAIVGGTQSSTPAGWTSIGSAASGSSSLGTCYAYYKIASSEPSSYTFTLNSSYLGVASVLCYRGTDTSTPIDTVNKNIAAATASSTNYNTASVTASGTQWAVSFAIAYEYGSSSTRTWTEGSGTERTDHGTAVSGQDNANMSVTDSAGAVSAGSFSRTQTRSSAADRGVKGIFLINDGGITVSAASATAVAAAAYQPTILIQTVQSATGSTGALEASVKVWPNADVADDSTAAAYSASRPMLPTSAAATTAAENASNHIDANAHDATVVTDGGDASGYYGAAVVRVYVIPSENRTYKVQR